MIQTRITLHASFFYIIFEFFLETIIYIFVEFSLSH